MVSRDRVSRDRVIDDDCRSAADVRSRSRAVLARRRELFSPPERCDPRPEPPLPAIPDPRGVPAIDALMNEVCAAIGIAPQAMLQNVDDPAATLALMTVLGLCVRRLGMVRKDVRALFGVVEGTMNTALTVVDRAWHAHSFTRFTDVSAIAEAVRAEWSGGRAFRSCPITSILDAVAAVTGVSRIDMVSERRTKTIVQSRHIAMALARCLTVHSLPDIGRRFGSRDHATVLHAVNKLRPAIEALERMEGGMDVPLDALVRRICELVQRATDV